MNWRFPIFGGPSQAPPQSNFPEIPWNSSQPSTPSNSSGGSAHERTTVLLQSSPHGQPSPTEAAGIISHLKNKRVAFWIDIAKCADELRRLLSDKEAYGAFFNSLDQVKVQNNLRHELRKETLQLAKENLEKEPQILELRNQARKLFPSFLMSKFHIYTQCTIIRTTELAAAQEKLTELERIKEQTLSCCSPSGLLEKLHEGMKEVDKESEVLHRQLLEKEVDLPSFVQKYKKLRTVSHRRALLRLAAKTSGLTA
ncbi:hypothetical protein ZIOFF_059210 [Zingiber officinale]|uniref:VPS37 C-terminal domain-containing protein n=1 Tax=Zingiber officinale TaxID=94328 RepID=A0A8J5F9Y2_ZINOF|nr:hypothetical protein ZIOFF_059210 [Zingiber officinale]